LYYARLALVIFIFKPFVCYSGVQNSHPKRVQWPLLRTWTAFI